jgi:hypothetical protein
MSWWWLSFADDDGFLGACIVEAPDVVQAAIQAFRHGCNPGGEVVGVKIPPDAVLGPNDTYRLIPEAEALAWDRTHGGPP